MNLKIYKRTRYQSIYQNIKNKNYIITISNPKSTISAIDNKKIFCLEDAIRIRDNTKTKLIKKTQIVHSDTFEELWKKYIYSCQNEEHFAYSTIRHKKIIHNGLKPLYNKRVGKILKKDIIEFITELDKTDGQKNYYLKILRAFFSWCEKENYIVINPTYGIKNIKIPKNKMKYWLPVHFKEFLKVVDNDICSNEFYRQYQSRLIKIFVLIELNIGDRPGETRALSFGDISKEYNTISIHHSINYDPNGKEYYSMTKNYQSQRDLDVSPKLIDEILDYKKYLESLNLIKVSNDTPILINFHTLKPISDNYLRSIFNYYISLAKVPKIRLYDLRHTYVATMMAEGWELYHISERLGHKSYSTTVDKYGHISDNVRKEIAKTTDKYY